MTPTAPYIHTLCRRNLGQGVGWYAPLELGEGEQGVCFAAPVRKDWSLFPSYRVQYLHLAGRHPGGWRVARAQTTGRSQIRFQIERQRFLLVARRVFGSYRALPYRGRLAHHDFRFRLVEFKAAEARVFDDLLEAKTIVVMGCDPHTNYLEPIGE